MARLGRSFPSKPLFGDTFRLFRSAAAGYTLGCAAAAFALTGNAATLRPSNTTLTATQASFTLTGQAATLNYSGASHTLTASPASFVLTGNAAGLGRNAVIVDQSTSYQTFKGWEATAQAGQEYLLPAETVEYPSTSYPNYKTALIEAMADLGLNRLRLEARLDDVNTTAYDPDGGTTAVQPSTAASGDWHYDRMTRGMDDIGVPLRNALIARGETLYVNLCIVDFDDTGYDAENTASEYAFFVNKFVTHFYNTYGFLPDAIETILEPASGQNATNWTAAKVANNLVAAQALLASSGPTGAGSIPFIAPSLEAGSLTETWMNDMTTANSAWETHTDQISYHRYSAPDNTTLASFRDVANAFGAYPAMTEKIGASHLDLYDDLISGHGVAWQQFTIAFPYTGWTDIGAEYFEVNTTTWAVTLNTRTKYLRQYFKYIRAGAVMKGVTNRSTTLLGVPFVNNNGAYVVPVKCTAGGTFDVLGLPAGTYGIRYTTGDGTSAPSAYDTALTTQTITAGGAVNVVMPAAGIVTIFDGNYRPAMPATVRTHTLTGNAATFVYGRKLTAAQATFTLTGNATGLNYGRTVTAAQATFTLTGNAAGLTAQRTITAANGAFTLTGNAAGLTAQRVIPATVGTFALTGVDAGLTYGSVGSYSLTANQAAFTLTGNAAGLTAQRRTTAANGSFTLTGQTANLNKGNLLTGANGSFTLSGQSASFTVALRLTAANGSFTFTGPDATLYGPPPVYAYPCQLEVTSGRQQLDVSTGQQQIEVSMGRQQLEVS